MIYNDIYGYGDIIENDGTSSKIHFYDGDIKILWNSELVECDNILI